MISKTSFLIFFISIFSCPLIAKLNVVTTLPEFAEIAQEVGGDKVQTTSLLKGTEDPHFLDAVPKFIQQLSNADVIILTGLELETGWLPKVLSKTGNPNVQPGGSGYLELGPSVQVLDVAAGPVDRSFGDVHPSGNPHFNLSIKALIASAEAIKNLLFHLDSENKNIFEAGSKSFQTRMKLLSQNIKNKLKTKNSLVIEYHKEFTYFFEEYGIKSIGSIEEKPGVPPSAARLAAISKSAQNQKVTLALGALFSPEKTLKKFSEQSQIPYKQVPSMVNKTNEKWNTIEKVQNAIAEAILQ